MYVSDDALDRLGCALVVDEGGGIRDHDDYFTPHEDATRFEHYDFNVGARLGMGQAADVCNKVGPDTIERRIANLSLYLIEAFAKAQLPSFLETPGPQATGIWTFASNELADPHAIADLQSHGVTLASIGQNYGRLALRDRGTSSVTRFSIHHTDTSFPGKRSRRPPIGSSSFLTREGADIDLGLKGEMALVLRADLIEKSLYNAIASVSLAALVFRTI